MGGGWENRFPVQLVGGFGVAGISISFCSTFLLLIPSKKLKTTSLKSCLLQLTYFGQCCLDYARKNAEEPNGARIEQNAFDFE